MKPTRSLFALFCVLSTTLVFGQSIQEETEKYNLRVELVAEGFGSPWAMAFLPSGELLVTERSVERKTSQTVREQELMYRIRQQVTLARSQLGYGHGLLQRLVLVM